MKKTVLKVGRICGLSLLILSALLVSAYFIFRLPPSTASLDAFRGIEIAHRGGYQWGPENTLPTMLLNLDRGAMGLEVDVQLSSEGIPVLYHDSTLHRINGVPGKPGDFNLVTLQGFPILDSDGHPTGTHIATLEALLDTLVRYPDVVLELDLKHFVEDQKALMTTTVDLVKKYHMTDRVLFSSFNPKTIYSLRKLDPQLITGFAHTEESGAGALMDWALNSPLVPLFLGVAVIEPHLKFVDTDYVSYWESRGMVINAWTANTASDKARLRALGVTMTTNCPGGECDDHEADQWGQSDVGVSKAEI